VLGQIVVASSWLSSTTSSATRRCRPLSRGSRSHPCS